jgi:hypothetical protein
LIGGLHGEGLINEGLAECYLKTGDIEQAALRAQNAIEVSRKFGNLRGQGHGHVILSKIAIIGNDSALAIASAHSGFESLSNSGVPEATLARYLLSAAKALAVGDHYQYCHALLRCAASPPNTGDLLELRDLASMAAQVATDLNYADLLREAKQRIDELSNIMDVFS